MSVPLLSPSSSSPNGISEDLRTLLLGNETALSFLQRKKSTKDLETGVEALDKGIREGLASGDIVEIYGESSMGLSQLCLSMCVTCVLPYTFRNLLFKTIPNDSAPHSAGCHNVLYFDLDDKFCVVRFMKMLERRIQQAIIVFLEEQRNQGIIDFDLDTLEIDDDITNKAFGDYETYIAFIKSCLRRVKVVRVQSAFQYWMTLEALLDHERHCQARRALGMNEEYEENYRMVFIDSLNVYSDENSIHRKDWERAIEALTRYATESNATVIAVKRENLYNRESRKKYYKNYFQEQEQQNYTYDHKLINELVRIHREIMPSSWTKRVNYRLLIDHYMNATHDAKAMVLQNVQQSSSKPFKVYRYWIREHGIAYDIK